MLAPMRVSGSVHMWFITIAACAVLSLQAGADKRPAGLSVSDEIKARPTECHRHSRPPAIVKTGRVMIFRHHASTIVSQRPA